MNEEPHESPVVPCWFCDLGFSVGQILRDGIIRSRAEGRGGPYWLFVCPSCLRENACEKTPKDRWFASPNLRISFLDYLFSGVLYRGSEEAQTLLAAISWFRENEERRRYFFQRDGDERYRGQSFLRRLWPVARTEERVRPRPRARPEAREAPLQTAPRPVISPHEVLGVRPNATEKQIRDAFRRLAMHYHPDKVYHRGEEFERMANAKFLELKQAYEALLERRKG